MIEVEYLRFLQTLSADDVSDDVLKIANLILKHIEELKPLSTAHGLRIKKTVELAQTNWKSICSEIQPLREQTEKQECKIMYKFRKSI